MFSRTETANKNSMFFTYYLSFSYLFTYCPVVLLSPKHPVYFDDATHDISADQFFTVSGKFMVIYGHYVDWLRNEIRRVNRWKYRWFNVSN